MFERSACASISSAAEPVPDTASHCALSQLLAHVVPASTGGCDLGSLIPDSDADLMSRDQKQEDNHAPLLNEDALTGVVRAAGKQRTTQQIGCHSYFWNTRTSSPMRATQADLLIKTGRRLMSETG
jgi:hypothetical protein